MQSSFKELVEDPYHSSDVAVMAQNLEYLVRLNEDMDTQKEDIEDQELYHDVGHQKVAKTEDFEAKTEDFEVKTGDFEAKTGDFEAKTEDFEAKKEDIEAKTGDFEAKTEDFEEKTEYFKEKTEDFEAKTGDYEDKTGDFEEETEDFEDESEDDDEEFSFTFNGSNESLITAEDAFVDGKLKPMFPLFNQELLLQDQYFEENLTHNPKVKKVLFQMHKDSLEKDSLGNDEISGPYCEWKGKASTSSEGQNERCKKSNSTGFSKLWRLKEVVNRSNSDGRDAFVFLKNGKDNEKIIKGGKTKTASSSHQNGAKKMVVGGGRGGGGGGGGGGGKSSAHEVYLKNKAKEKKKVYKPEVFGFFTNVNGGMSKNVHPY